MDEWSRIVLEEYCRKYNSAKSRRIAELVRMSYDVSAIGTDDDAIFLETAISRERNPERKKALQDLDEYLFGW